MKLFLFKGKREKSEDERPLALDPGTATDVREAEMPGDAQAAGEADPATKRAQPADAEAESTAAEGEPDSAAAESAPDKVAPEPARGEPRTQDDLLAQIGAEAAEETAKEEATLEKSRGPGAGKEDEEEELDPELLDLFRDARNEVQESSLAAEVEEVSGQELLREALDISNSLGAEPGSAVEARTGESEEAEGAEKRPEARLDGRSEASGGEAEARGEDAAGEVVGEDAGSVAEEVEDDAADEASGEDAKEPQEREAAATGGSGEKRIQQH